MVSITATITTPITFLEYAKSCPEQDPTRTFVENMVAESDLMRAIPILPAQRQARLHGHRSLPPSASAAQRGRQPGDRHVQPARRRYVLHRRVHLRRPRDDRSARHGAQVQAGEAEVDRARPVFTQKFIKGDTARTRARRTALQARCNTLSPTCSTIRPPPAAPRCRWPTSTCSTGRSTSRRTGSFPRGLMPFFDAAARNNTLVNQTVAYAKDDFGRRIIKYKGLPILFGYEPDDSPDMLPFTEVAAGGGGAVTSRSTASRSAMAASTPSSRRR
jgi:hypothetical protein